MGVYKSLSEHIEWIRKGNPPLNKTKGVSQRDWNIGTRKSALILPSTTEEEKFLCSVTVWTDGKPYNYNKKKKKSRGPSFHWCHLFFMT